MSANYDNFVFYGDIMESLENLPTEQDKKDVALAILRYGTSGEWDDSNLFAKLILPLVKPGIDKAKDRYITAVENGRKGGRPSVELIEDEVMEKKQELGTWKAVAKYYGVTEQTLRNKRAEWEKQKNQKNLNNNININNNINNNNNKNNKVFLFDLSLDEDGILAEIEESYKSYNENQQRRALALADELNTSGAEYTREELREALVSAYFDIYKS